MDSFTSVSLQLYHHSGLPDESCLPLQSSGNADSHVLAKGPCRQGQLQAGCAHREPRPPLLTFPLLPEKPARYWHGTRDITVPGLGDEKRLKRQRYAFFKALEIMGADGL